MRRLGAVLLAFLLLSAGPSAAWVDPDSTRGTYVATVVGTAATASKDMLNVFNAAGSGKVLRVLGIRYTASNAAAVTSGLNSYVTISRTSTAGATCTAVTIQSFDSTNAAVPAQVTAGTNCTTDPTVSFALYGCAVMTEETASTDDRACHVYQAEGAQAITLREGEGIMVKTTALNAVGAVTVAITFSM